jgi:hypothetical protein
MKKKTTKMEDEIKSEIEGVLNESTFDDALLELEEQQLNKQEQIFDNSTTIGVDEFYHYQFNSDENVILLSFTGYIEHVGEQQDGMLLLSPRQIEQIYSYLKYRESEINWNKFNRG